MMFRRQAFPSQARFRKLTASPAQHRRTGGEI